MLAQALLPPKDPQAAQHGPHVSSSMAVPDKAAWYLTLCGLLQVLGMVGSTRKRVMHIWHAVETCKAIQFYPLETMQVSPVSKSHLYAWGAGSHAHRNHAADQPLYTPVCMP